MNVRGQSVGTTNPAKRNRTTKVTFFNPISNSPAARTLSLSVLLGLLAVWCMCLAASAAAAPTKPHWLVQSVAQPTNFELNGCPNNPETSENEGTAHGCDRFTVLVSNVGAAATDGSTVTISDQVPAGLRLVTKEGGAAAVINGKDEMAQVSFPCTAAGRTVTCNYEAVVPSEDILVVDVAVEVEPGTPAGLLGENQVSVVGGGASPRSATSPASVEQPDLFHLLGFGVEALGADGNASLRAGDHPNLVTGTFEMSSKHRGAPGVPINNNESALPVENLKDALVYLPPGMVGNPQVLPTCSPIQVATSASACPVASRVGTVVLNSAGSLATSVSGVVSYLYNVPPEAGYAAAFAFEKFGKVVVIQAALVHVGGPGGGYALRVGSSQIPKVGVVNLTGLSLGFWGNPSAHNGGPLAQEAFLTDPTNCSGPLSAKLEVDSWENPGVWSARESIAYPVLEGCEGLNFSPTLTMRPEVTTADSPSGYEAVLRVPQNPNTAPALATAQLKDARVTLPEGVAISPSAANGLAGCAAEGPEGINIGSDVIGFAGQDLGDPEATEFGAGHKGGNGSRYDDGIWHTAPGHCPNASQIGTVRIKTPLLAEEVEGHIYVARPSCTRCSDVDATNGQLYGIYLEAEAPKAGVIVKLHGEVSADPRSGRLTAMFKDNPQLPFEELRLKFDGGPGAVLANPQTCGTRTIQTDLTPWSTPQTPDATPKDSFAVDAGANGGGCISSEAQAPNAPRFEAGTTNPLAGAYTPFILKVSREDGSQRLERINLSLPPGLSGKLAGIPYCSDAQIAAASGRSGAETLASSSCPSASEVGKVTVGAGPGTKPYYVHGRVYLAGPYKGAPLSLVIVTPAVAGPFDLGTVVVRSALSVNEEDAQITAKSDPIPRILDGTLLDVRSIAIELDRSQFTLNPTNCEAMNITGSAVSITGSVAPLTNHFQVGGCKGLGYHPSLKLQVKGAVKRTGHPAFKAVVTFPHKEAEANTARIQVGLPKSLFLDQGNLNKVCKQAELKAATCPASSIYGEVKAWTPILEKPLEGPVYLGVGFGYKLPALVTDLNGQVRILAHGKVDTTKQHGLRTTFEVVPDAPINRLVLEMKGGKKYGLLENSENLCRAPQQVNARFVAQNGLVEQLHPKITSGCKGSGRNKSSKAKGGGGKR